MNLTHNRLFSQLTPADQAALQKISSRQELSARQVLGSPEIHARNAYFLTGASVALVVKEGTDLGLALGLVGHEGAVGLQFALGLGFGVFTLLVQTPGTAWIVDGAALERLCHQRPALLFTLSSYVWTMTQELAVFAAFAQVSDIKPRLAHWILTSYSRSRRKELTLTQLHLAEMLGVRRASITLAAVELRAAKLIEYRRGKLLVLDAAGLEAVAKGSSF